MSDTILIVGASHAGVHGAEALRKEGFAGRIVLVGAEPHLPYQRPPLSKKLLAGELPFERTLLKPASFYEQSRIELRLGTRVTAVSCDQHQATLSTGETLIYDRMLLCLGSRGRPLDVPGLRLSGVVELRTYDDVVALRSRFRPGARLVVVGAGYIGLEVAATCLQLGFEVTVLEMTDRAMSRVVAPQVSAFYATEHAARGVKLHFNTVVTAFDGDSEVREVVCADGRRFAAEVVVVGIGILPVTELARAAGIACDNGILVDEHCRTSAADVYAAGDCTNHPSLRYGRRVRLESVDNAFEQARSAAANLLDKPMVHDKVPWFWSDQFDLKLLIVGLSQGYDSCVLRGELAARSFCLCYLRAGELIAVDALNSAKDYMAARKLIAERAHLDSARIADATVPLKEAH
ncbi:MAG TPA: FAD-dependent oxidoreductase [Steroidobacteraceae bacterium]|nr:FAD-dependent oxidoreductase [Steroidobacteraceae bacterium]